MTDLAQLERLLASDAALEQARISQGAALRTQDLLTKPLSNFNAGSLSDPALQPALERLQASIRVQDYFESGNLTHVPPRPPPIGNTGTAGSAGSAGNAALDALTSVGGNTITTPRVNAPATVPLPTSGLGSLLRAYDVYQMIQQGSIAVGNVGTGLGNIGSILSGNPESVQPFQPYFADPTEDFLQRLNQGQQNLFGSDARQVNPITPANNPPSPQRGNAGVGNQLGLVDGLLCNIFGINCPSNDPVPNSGSPGLTPPFYGGQSSGVSYQVDIYREQYNSDGSMRSGYPSTTTHTAIGPIQGLRIRDAGGVQVLELLHNGSPIYLGNTSTPGQYFAGQQLSNIRRTDGQPDTGGNPAPLSGASNRPATTPALNSPQVFPPPNAPDRDPATVPNPGEITTPTTPTAPPGTTTPTNDPPDADRDSPLSPFNPNLPFIPAFTPVRPPSGSNTFDPSGTQQPTTDPPRTTTTTDEPSLTCRYDNRNISGKVDQANVTLQAVELFMQQQMMSKLDVIDAKLGKQIPGGGISGFLDTMFGFAKKTWNFLQVDRVLNVLSWIGILHNAFMLSNALGQSLFAMVSIALDAFGIEDAEGNPFDVGSVVGEWTEGFFNNLLGEETVDNIQATWAKWNRIYQAASNLLYSIQSMFYSMAEILEVISNYVGKIGNALMKSGTILQNSFNWMNTNANFTDNRFFKFLQRTQDGVEIVEQIFSEVVSIQETAVEFQEQSEQFSKEFGKEEDTIGATENKLADDQRTNIQITPVDEVRAEGE
jgi:hypothetical protein